MDSHEFVGGKRDGHSKAQMCLQKILSIISSVPSHQYQQNSKPKPSFYHLLQVHNSSSTSNSFQDEALPFGNEGFHIDLNLELTSSAETENSSSVGIDSTYQAKSNQEKSTKDDSLPEEKRNPVSETDVEDEKKETEPFCDREFGQEDGSSPSFTETGELSSKNDELQRGGLGSELGIQEINGKELVKEERKCWVVGLHGRFDEVSHVVRTKRGRRRMLPCRYKDSVLQPLARNPNTRKRQRFKVMKSM